MTCHMALHNDMLGRIHTILKQDDYFRTLEELPVLNVELEVTSQQSVLPNNRIIDSRIKDVKVLIKDAKLAEKIGRNHRTDYSSQTRPTNALTVQVIMELRTV